MEIKKLYEANSWWNYWKFQLHWNKLEWINPISLIKIFFFSFFNYIYINKGDIKSNWVGHFKLKEFDTNYSFERKHMIEDMEAELTEAYKNFK